MGVGVCVIVDVWVGVMVAVVVLVGTSVKVDVNSLIEVVTCSSGRVAVGLENTPVKVLHPSVIEMNAIINNTLVYLFLYIPDI